MSDAERRQHDTADAIADAAPDALTAPESYTPAKGTAVIELDMGDGLILYNHDASLVHHLNPSAAIVWQLCDGRTTVAQLSWDIAAEYGLPGEQVQEQVAAVIAEFDALGLVEDSRPAGPSTDAG